MAHTPATARPTRPMDVPRDPADDVDGHAGGAEVAPVGGGARAHRLGVVGERVLKLAVLLGMVGTAVQSVIVPRGLYADGSTSSG